MNICLKCGRKRHESPSECEGRPVRVLHGGYGCDTGCCGHRVVAEYEAGYTVDDGETFFEHDRTALMERAQTYADRLGVPFDQFASEFVDD